MVSEKNKSTQRNCPLVKRALPKNTREKSKFMGDIDREARDTSYCTRMVTSVRLVYRAIVLMCLSISLILSTRSSALGARTRGGHRRDSTRLNTRDTALANITLSSALLEGDIAATI